MSRIFCFCTKFEALYWSRHRQLHTKHFTSYRFRLLDIQNTVRTVAVSQQSCCCSEHRAYNGRKGGGGNCVLLLVLSTATLWSKILGIFRLNVARRSFICCLLNKCQQHRLWRPVTGCFRNNVECTAGGINFRCSRLSKSTKVFSRSQSWHMNPEPLPLPQSNHACVRFGVHTNSTLAQRFRNFLSRGALFKREIRHGAQSLPL
jgi:hypothetical protein